MASPGTFGTPHRFPGFLGECLFGLGVGEGFGAWASMFVPAIVMARISSAAVHVRAETMPVTAFPSLEVKPS